MGWIRDQHGRLCCDFCAASGARKIACPVGYCQAWAVCADCRRAGKHHTSSTGGGELGDHHATCRVRMKEINDRLDAFRRGGFTLHLYRDGAYFRVDDPHYHEYCGHFNKTFVERQDIAALRAMGHQVVVIRERSKDA